MVAANFALLRDCNQRFFTVTSRHRRDSYDSVMVTSNSFVPSSETLRLLRRPPKFSPTPTRCCHSDIRLAVNDFIRKFQWRSLLPQRPNLCRFRSRSSRYPSQRCVHPTVLAISRKLRASVNSCLRSCGRCFPTSNLEDAELAELKRLRDDPSLTILPADKGGKWVVMPTVKYVAEAERQLRDQHQYKEVFEDIDKTTKQRLVMLLRHLRANNFVSIKEARALLPPSRYQPRRFYLLPKVHKDDWPDEEMPPGRPIVSDVGSVSRPCDALVELFLSPIV